MLKFSRFMLAVSLMFFGVLLAVTPVVNVEAQDSTPTPSIVIVTATPNAPAQPAGGAPAGGQPPAAGSGGAQPAATDAAGTPVPREVQALRLARTEFSKKLGRRIDYVKAWTWELLMFKDQSLGCPASGETAVKGDTAGFRITITTLDNVQGEFHVKWDLSKVFTCSSIGQGTGGAAPITANPAGNLPAPVAGSAAVGGFEAGAHIYGWNANVVARLNQSGLRWIKKQISPSDNSAADIISVAHAAGFKVMLGIKGSREEVLNPGFFDQFASYVGQVAKAGADAIEVWNEMNIDREWPAGQIDPAKYTELLAKSYNAIKSNNPNTIVISGALSPTGYFNGTGGKSAQGWNDDLYYQGMAAAGAGKYMDCVGIHYNEGIISPNQGSGDPRGGYPTYYFDSMVNRALGPFGNKVGCFTELGFLTPQGFGSLPGGFAWAQNVTVAQQATWLAEAAVKSATSGRIRIMIIWNLDFVRFDSDPMGGYAIMRPDGSCPACDSLAKVLKK